MSKVRFCPISSGSSGNSLYIGAGESHILIDAGLSGIRIQERLKALSVDTQKICAIFISHEHSDHIQGVGVLSRRFDIPIYASLKTWHTLDRYNMIGKIAPHNKKTFSHGESVSINGDLFLKPFQTSHDASDPSGFNIFAGDYKMSVSTDLGTVTDSVKENIYDSDILLIESNHDLDMLKNGSYPWMLKKRILGDFGHLSNVTCGTLLADIYSPRIKHVYLGHLSEENNLPLLALDTVKSILFANKIDPDKDFSLHLANRGIESFCVSL